MIRRKPCSGTVLTAGLAVNQSFWAPPMTPLTARFRVTPSRSAAPGSSAFGNSAAPTTQVTAMTARAAMRPGLASSRIATPRLQRREDAEERAEGHAPRRDRAQRQRPAGDDGHQQE